MDAKLLVTVIGIILVLIIHVATAAYVYGKLTSKVAAHDKSIDELKATDKSLWGITNHNSEAIANLRGRMNLNGEAKKATHH